MHPAGPVVEPLIHEMTEEAAGLRHAPTDGICDARRWIPFRGGGVLEEADDVARAGKANTDDPWIAGIKPAGSDAMLYHPYPVEQQVVADLLVDLLD